MCWEYRRSWNSCRWPERVIFTTDGVSDHLEATSYFIGNIAEHFGASTAISLADTKNMLRYREDGGLNKYKALFTQPRPKVATHFYITGVCFGHIAALDVSKLNVSFHQRRHSNSQHQCLPSANSSHSEFTP